MPLITNIGGGEFLFGLGLVFLLFKSKRVRTTGILLMAGLTFSYHLVSILKNLFERQRPFLGLDSVNALIITGGYSFPSNHASMAFMAAVVLSRCFRGGYLFYFAACLVAISRVYLGVHYPSDVLAGSCIGAMIGFVLVYVSEKIGTYRD